MTLKLASQGESNSGDGRMDRTSLDVKDVFEVCTGARPTKTQGIFLFMNCGELTNNTIAAIDTQPFGELAPVGGLSLNGPLISVTKNGDTKSVTMPATLQISCDAGMGGLALIAPGVLTLKYSALGGTTCPESATLKVTGSGGSSSVGLPGSFIVDDGTAVKAKNRDGAIASFPVPF
ncbi:MAG TPA: hypothetical protein VMR86_06695 [Myxococcota bacterium]|nr:hypothetical protein [Myxococcota bacterium]